MRRFWIKLWLDILEDEKLLVLDEVHQLRFIKLCLLSAKLDMNGMLPPVENIAFWLRLTPKQVDLTIRVLSKCGVVLDKSNSSWFIVNFEKRQAALSGTDRSRLSRLRDDATKMQRKGNETLQGSVPLSSVPLSSDSPPYSLSLKDKEFSEISTLYSNEIGELTRMSSEILSDAIEDYTADWIKSAIAEAVRQNARSWAYVEAILTRWKRDGFQSKKAQGSAAPDAAWINVTELRLAEEAGDV